MMRAIWTWLAASAALAALAGAGGAWAQRANAAANSAVNPQELVKDASYNELQASNQGHPFRYKLHKVDDGKITTKLIIETKDGDVARLVATGDKPLSAEAQQTEIQRLQTLLGDPSIQEHRRKREQADSTRANEMVRLLPDAFLYKYIGMAQTASGPAYRLSFVPNPNFTPPDREAEVYHGMAGELWIDQKQERMAKLDAHLIADVDFGWGIVGKLFKGGSILVEQKDVGDGHWEANLLKLDLEGKILLVKSLTIDTTEQETDFAPVPASWGYQDAVKALLAEK